MRTFFTEKQLWPIKNIVWRPRICVLFHRKTAVTNQNISEHWSMSFERANIVPQNFLHSRKLIQFPKSTESVEEETKSLHHESDKVNIFTEITLWVRFSLLTQSAHGPGEDPFEAVMCTVGAASQISFCLLKDLFLIQNITCISTGFYFIKSYSTKRYTVKRLSRIIFGCRIQLTW